MQCLKNEYDDENFSDLNFNGEEVSEKTFENCTFNRSNFSKAKLTACRFINCLFKNCDLSSMEVTQSSFRNVIFEDSKVIGVNWTKAKRARLANEIHFYRSNVSYSNFLGLNLSEMTMEKSQAHDADFREANLSKCNLFATDFKGSLFSHTNLNKANFVEAINYNINPLKNDIRNGKFSLPDVITLLACFNVRVQ